MRVHILSLFCFTIVAKRFSTFYCQRMKAPMNSGMHTSIFASIKTITTGIWVIQNSQKKCFAHLFCVVNEQLLSIIGNIFEAKRSRLLPKHGVQIAFLNYNLSGFIDWFCIVQLQAATM